MLPFKGFKIAFGDASFLDEFLGVGKSGLGVARVRARFAYSDGIRAEALVSSLKDRKKREMDCNSKLGLTAWKIRYI